MPQLDIITVQAQLLSPFIYFWGFFSLLLSNIFPQYVLIFLTTSFIWVLLNVVLLKKKITANLVCILMLILTNISLVCFDEIVSFLLVCFSVSKKKYKKRKTIKSFKITRKSSLKKLLFFSSIILVSFKTVVLNETKIIKKVPLTIKI